jgi:hypothetical protein
MPTTSVTLWQQWFSGCSSALQELKIGDSQIARSPNLSVAFCVMCQDEKQFY